MTMGRRRSLLPTPVGHVHVRSVGERGAPGVVFFHQSPSSSRMWEAVMDQVAAAGFACAAPDMFDYGHSDSQTRQLSLAEHAHLLLEASAEVVGPPVLLVGHHTGAVFAAAASSAPSVRGLTVFGYPLYESWRVKFARLGARIGPDSVSEEGSELADLWVALNRSIEPATSDEVRHTIYTDRMLASPLWFTAYVALLGADLAAPLADAVQRGLTVETVFARDDAVSRLEGGVSELTGVAPVWIDGGAWVTMEHPERVAKLVVAGAERLT